MFMGGGIQRAEGHARLRLGDPSRRSVAGEHRHGRSRWRLPPAVNNNRDRMDRVEALSGWNFNDILRGDDRATLGVRTPSGT